MRQPKLEIFPRGNGKWYWHLKAANGAIVADGAEGYDSRGNAFRAIRRARTLMARAVLADISMK